MTENNSPVVVDSIPYAPVGGSTKKKKHEKKFFVGLDLEGVSNTDINGIGLCVLNRDGVVVFKKSWWMNIPDECVDPVMKKEFWEKFPEVWKNYKENAKDIGEQIKDFQKTWDGLAKIVGAQDEKELELVSNNPEYDYARLTKYLKEHCNRDPVRYTTDGSHRSIIDIGEVSWFLGVHDVISKAASDIQEHNHNPDNDAENICLKHIFTSKFVEKVVSKYGDELKEIAKETCEQVTNSVLGKRKETEK